MTRRAPVTFVPAGVTVWVECGSTILDAARQAGLMVPAPCGGRGICASCGARVISGELEDADEYELVGLRRAPAGVRLACRARVTGACEVRPLIAANRVVSLGEEGYNVSLAAGIDLGTTSVAALLVDDSTGLEVARAAVPNLQQAFGADVLTRISAALDGAAVELRVAAETSVVSAIQAAAARGGVQPAGIRRLVIAANSAMMGLLLGADVTPLATAPFSAPSPGGDLAAESRIRAMVPSASCQVLPPIAGFVGGDAVAAAIAGGLIDADRPILLVDFGTNAEIILAGSGSLVVASAAAGPAFEGGGISCGGPAAEGAVTHVAISEDGSIGLSTLGGDKPRWFSGSGIVSAVAELVRTGHVQPDGLLVADGPLAERFSKVADVVTVSLGDSDACVSVNQLDIRAVQLAKAAVRVGITAVLKRAGVSASDLAGVRIAGAFGSAMSARDLVDLGIVPAENAEVVVSVGNAALEGAAIVALDGSLLDAGASLAKSARHVDLARDPGFPAALMEATRLAPYSVTA